MKYVLCPLALCSMLLCQGVWSEEPDNALFTYTLTHDGSPDSYDDAIAVGCLQGLINRTAPRLYVLSPRNGQPKYWLDALSQEGRWLQTKRVEPLPDLDALFRLAGPGVKGAVIWDPEVPATVNVATTIAGVEDGVVVSPAHG